MFHKISDRCEDEYGEEEYGMADSIEPLALICFVAILMIIMIAAFQ